YNTITNAEKVIEDIDTVVLVYGGQAENQLYRVLKGKVKELYAIGDCLAPRRVEQAIYEGHKVAREI
ncbi:unnamed protein product, partial [marine sediment metagenome]